ncbi:MobF family relaxase [Cellulomonas sp. URHD0024]|uniref:MobF family relaxase n=1 Tax=Cellulomonas sp. URHD0024 TaxID=1302620 RepID=UPI000419BD51|nr:MobF family relaxase [Cellulomonas sp. URHD0024]
MVMTLHRLTAGAGYQYLLKHTATGDCDRSGGASLTAYYTQSGNPPGRWLGAGLTGIGGVEAVGLEVGALVEETPMARLFGQGCDPLTGAPLGHSYRVGEPVAKRVEAQVRALPALMVPDARRAAIAAITRVELSRSAPKAIAGFDLTFTPPKSVSTLWAVADDHTQAVILEAHRAAVEQALAFLQDRALFTRTGHAGCRQELTQGAVAVGFDHWDSRAGDPNLHTHVVVANKVQGPDGTWRSLDSRALHHATVTISEVYDALMADELARRLPVRWGWRHRGPRRSPRLEVKGVGDGLMGEFSTRSTRIDEAMTDQVAKFAATHGRTPNRIEITRLRQQVTRATRPRKHVRPLVELLAAWRKRAAELTGRTPEQLTDQAVGRSRTVSRRAVDVAGEEIRALAETVLGDVMERRSTWTRWNVLAEAARLTRGIAMASPPDRLALLDAVADAALSGAVSIAAPQLFVPGPGYQRPDGTSVFDRPDEERFTDQRILAAEARLLSAAAREDGPATSAAALVVAAADQRMRLAADQVEVVRRVAMSGRRLEILVGPAGSGKTTTLRGVRRAWEHTYGRGSAVGLAPSSSAAAELAKALNVACENTAKWIHESVGQGAQRRAAVTARLNVARDAAGKAADRRAVRIIETALAGQAHEATRWSLRPGQLVIVDEASLAGTFTLDTIVTQADVAGAKVLLVGDHAQLSAVDAGGAFALLAHRTSPARLTSLWRFSQPWEAAASLGLRDGNPSVLEDYVEHDRVHSGAAEAMLEDAYTAWANDLDAGSDAILLAPDARTVAALNARAHRDRVADGLVAPTGVPTASGELVGVGDRIVTRRNDRTLRPLACGPHAYVRNGDLWIVTDTQPDGSVTASRTRSAAGTDSATVLLPAGYVQHDVELGYAITTHRAQGITVDRAHVLAHPGMARENLYVAISRGRHANHIYVALDAVDPDCDDLPDVPTNTTGREVLATIITSPGAEQSATAQIVTAQEAAGSVHRLEPIRRTLLAEASRNRWTLALQHCGLSQTEMHTLATSPDAVRLFATLDKIATVTTDPVTVLRESVAVTANDASTVASLAGAANAWLRSRVENPHDVPATSTGAGLGDDGLAMLESIQELIEQRTTALTDAVLDHRPAWLERLGPEPRDPGARAAWLAEITTTVAHLDQQRPTQPIDVHRAPTRSPEAVRTR